MLRKVFFAIEHYAAIQLKIYFFYHHHQIDLETSKNCRSIGCRHRWKTRHYDCKNMKFHWENMFERNRLHVNRLISPGYKQHIDMGQSYVLLQNLLSDVI